MVIILTDVISSNITITIISNIIIIIIIIISREIKIHVYAKQQT